MIMQGRSGGGRRRVSQRSARGVSRRLRPDVLVSDIGAADGGRYSLIRKVRLRKASAAPGAPPSL